MPILSSGGNTLRDKTLRAIGATAVLIGIVVAALAQTGSGDASTLEITTPPPVDSTSSSTIAVTGSKTRATTLLLDYRVGLLAGVSTQNFWIYYDTEPTVWNAYVLGPTKPALFVLDPAENTLVPELSKIPVPKPTRNADGWGVRVRLRSDLLWSDGTPVTADDFVFTFDTVRKLSLGGGWSEGFPEVIESVVADSQQLLRIEFTEQPSLSVWPFGLGLTPIMPRHVWSEVVDASDDASDLYAADADTDVSGGPLQIVSFGDSEIETVANPGYPTGSFGSVRFVIYESEEAAAEALAADDIHIILSPKGIQLATAETLAAQPGIVVESSPANAVSYLGFNLNRDPMAAHGFREAVALLVDREAAVAQVAPGSDAAYTLLPPANTTWQNEDEAETIADLYAGSLEERLARALETLEAEGYSWSTRPRVGGDELVAGEGLKIDGVTPEPLTILTSGDKYDPARPKYATVVESAIQVLGFDVRVVITDFDTVVDLAFTPQDDGPRPYDMYLLGWTLGNPALPSYYQWLFAKDAPTNSTGYDSPDFTAALAIYQGAFDNDEARSALWDMEETIARELPYLVLYHPQILEAYRADRVRFELPPMLGGIQARGGGLADLITVS